MQQPCSNAESLLQHCYFPYGFVSYSGTMTTGAPAMELLAAKEQEPHPSTSSTIGTLLLRIFMRYPNIWWEGH